MAALQQDLVGKRFEVLKELLPALEGAAPGELSVEQAAKFVLAVNQATVKSSESWSRSRSCYGPIR